MPAFAKVMGGSWVPLLACPAVQAQDASTGNTAGQASSGTQAVTPFLPQSSRMRFTQFTASYRLINAFSGFRYSTSAQLIEAVGHHGATEILLLPQLPKVADVFLVLQYAAEGLPHNALVKGGPF